MKALQELKERVWQANVELPRQGLVKYTWGNVSGIDRELGLVVIKPSGVPYAQLTSADMVVVSLDGQVVEGELNPSSDTPTHLELYKALPALGAVVHTHSTWATVWAQAGRAIPCLGTTHADYFYGSVPCTRGMTRSEVEGDYETNTGRVIVETLAGSDPSSVPGVLVAGHGPFAWGADPQEAVHNGVVLEEIAKLALFTQLLNPEVASLSDYLLDKHFLRKHGADAYYGQK